MTALAALLLRDARLAVRVGGGALIGVLFFLIVVTLVPFAIGPDLALLARIGPAVLWLGALLANLLALDRLIATDYEDGSLDLILTARVPVEEYGVLEMAGGRISRIIETKGAEGVDRGEARYINSGQYAVRGEWLWSHLARIAPSASGERYLTELASMAHAEGNPGVAVEAADRCRPVAGGRGEEAGAEGE